MDASTRTIILNARNFADLEKIDRENLGDEIEHLWWEKRDKLVLNGLLRAKTPEEIENLLPFIRKGSVAEAALRPAMKTIAKNLHLEAKGDSEKLGEALRYASANGLVEGVDEIFLDLQHLSAPVLRPRKAKPTEYIALPEKVAA